MFFRRESAEETFDKAAAQGLGWTSIAIGLTEIAAPKQLERAMGIGDGENTGILRVLGVREVLHGVDLLAHPEEPRPGVLARVAGDLLDGALLVAAARKTKNVGGFMTVCALVLPVVALDLIFARRLNARR